MPDLKWRLSEVIISPTTHHEVKKMAIRPSDIRPLELAANSFVAVRESWVQILFAGGIFVLLSQLIVFFTKSSGIPAMVEMGNFAGSFTMLLATVAVSLVTCARVLGVQIPYLPSALINDRYFWKYVWAALVCSFLSVLAALACVLVASFVVPLSAGLDFYSVPFLFTAGFAAVAWFIVYVRLFMVMPAVAIGEKVSLSASLRRTRGVSLKVALSVVIALGGFIVAEYVFKGAAPYGGDPASSALLNSLAVVLKLVRCAVEGALAGFIFKKALEAEAVTTEE